MKKFSKESFQNFMLMHAEKLILGGCLAATGVFVWMSMGGEKDVTETPSKLLDKANQAQAYINREAWEIDGNGLKEFRKGEDAAKDKIANAKVVDPDKYPLRMLGIPAASLAPRQDPEIVKPEQLIATRLTAGVLLEIPDARSRLAGLYPAPASEEGGVDFGGGGGFGRGGGEDFGEGDFGSGGSGADRGGLPENFPPLDRSAVFNEVNAFTMPGLRPKGFSISPDRITSSVFDVVCVTAVVDFQKQAAAFEKAFSESVAYNAKRDRPVYQFLQVQRKEISDQETEWQDISEEVVYSYPQRCPTALPRMPFQLFTSAPEVIAPENYDPILSGVIPAFVMLDYQQIASHPALKKQREFPAWEPKGGKRIFPKDDMFGPSDSPDEEFGSRGGPGSEDGSDELRKGSETESYREAIVMRKPGGQYRLVRFFDLLAPKNITFEYRVRVWIGDPNQRDPNDGFQKNRGQRLEANAKDGGIRFAGTGAGMDREMSSMDDPRNDDLENKKPEVIQDIQTGMLHPKVRDRLRAASELGIMQERLEQQAGGNEPMEPFYVAELSEEGKLEQIELPPSKT